MKHIPQIDCAACGSQTILHDDGTIQDLPLDPLVALYSAVPSQVLIFLKCPQRQSMY